MSKYHNPLSNLFLLQILPLTLIGSFSYINIASALPEGGNVTAGEANINQVNSNQLNINQSSDRSVIDWNSFNINQSETVNIIQPNNTSALLNRVTGNTPSNIAGNINANGQIMLVNPNGILFTQTANINVGGLLATTLDITNNDFLNNNLNFFSVEGKAPATVENYGNITVAESGIAALVAPGVINNGVINARLGKVILASGERLTLDFYGDGLISIELDPVTASQIITSDGTPLTALITNNGEIYNDGGIIQISAATASELLNKTINMDGVLQARSVQNVNGNIVLGGENGEINVNGLIDVSGNNLGENGGKIVISGDTVNLPQGLIDISGENKGGELFVYANNLNLGINVNTSEGSYVLFDPIDLIVGTTEANTFVTSLSGGGTVNVSASNSITVNALIDSSLQGNNAILNFIDENSDNNLTVNLNEKIILGTNQSLTGQATIVNLAGNGLVQNAVNISASGGIINLANGNFLEGKQIDINKNITINGQGQTNTFLTGNNHRVVNITGGNVTLNNLTIRNGNTGGNGGAINVSSGATVNLSSSTISGNTAARGGAINNYGSVNITNSIILGNTATNTSSGGGGIHNSTNAKLTITDSTISNNSATFGGGILNVTSTTTITNSTIANNTASNGGGIRNSNNGVLNITNSTISGNYSAKNATISVNDTRGGGINNEGATATITNSTITNNFAHYGGGIRNSASQLTITNSTISNNSTTFGGGVLNTNSATANITNSTISGNSATANGYPTFATNNTGGGIRNSASSILNLTNVTISNNTADTNKGGGILNDNTSTITLSNSLIANSFSGSDFINSGTLNINGKNIVEDSSLMGANILNVDPLLAPLANYGGTTQTHLLLPGSPAIDAGVNNALTTDQRGGIRIYNIIDIGSVEFQGTTLSITRGNNQNTTVNTAFNTAFITPLEVKVAENIFNNPFSGINITFTPHANINGASTKEITQTVVTNNNGIALINVTANTITGNHSIIASSPGLTSQTFYLTNLPGEPASLTINNGDNQNTIVNTQFKPLTIIVKDEYDNLVTNTNLNFDLTRPIIGASIQELTKNITTDNNGIASLIVTANTIAGGEYQITATTNNLTPINFNLTNDPDRPASLTITGGNNQNTTVNTAFANALQVQVKDQFGNLIPNANISLIVPNTGAGVQQQNQTITTDINGMAQLTVIANNIAGEFVILAELDQLIPIEFNLTNMAIPDNPIINNPIIYNLDRIENEVIINDDNFETTQLDFETFICVESEKIKDKVPYFRCDQRLTLNEE